MKQLRILLVLIGILILSGGCVWPPRPAQQQVAATATASATPVRQTSPSATPTAPELEDDQEEPAPATNTPSPTPAEMGPETFPAGVNPLTGQRVADPALLDRRPMAIKVSNFPPTGRPHSGLSFADWVWEYFIGEGMTRFVAIFYGQDAPQAGPMRSARLIDGQITRLHGGVLGMASGDPTVIDSVFGVLPGRAFNAKPALCPALCLKGIIDSFADTAAFSEYVESQGVEGAPPELPGLFFSPDPPTGGEPVQDLWIYYSFNNQIGWTFDPAGGAYLRSQDKADGTGELHPMTDAVTGDRLGFNNVLVLLAPHEFRSPTLIDIGLWYSRGQRAILFRDGQAFEATYGMDTPDTPLRFVDAAGNPLALKPGNTWVEVVGSGSTVQVLEDGTWKVRFYP